MTSLRQRLAEAQVALMFLTRLPAGSLPARVPSLAEAAWAYPLVGVVTGGALWAVLAGAGALGLSPLVGAVLALVALTMLTGALHHDGLADCADGLGGGRDRDHVLEIMRDSRIGSYGVVALVLVLGLQAAALSEITLSPPALIALAVASRFWMILLLAILPPARSDGLGRSAVITWPMLLPGAVATLALILLSGLPWWILPAMTLPVLWLAHRAKRRIGGHTGDVLGASQILSESLGWALLTLI